MSALTRSKSKMSSDKKEAKADAESADIPNVPQWIQSLIKTFTEDVKDLKESVANLITENNELKQTVGVLQKRLQISEGLTIRNQSKIIQQADQITDLKCRSMRDNIVINGIPEKNNESWEESKEKFEAFLQNDLKIANLEDVKADRVHRIGQKMPNKPRPMVVKLISTASKDNIFKNVKNLKNKKELSVQEQLPPEVNECRKRLWAKYKEAKSNPANRVSWAADRLIINGVSFSAKDENVEINSQQSAGKTTNLQHTTHTTVEDSTFMGHVAGVESKDDIPNVLAELMKDKAVAGATHNIYAYRIQGDDGKCIEGSKDDGEHGAGYQLLKILRDRGEINTMVIVTRWFGSKHLGKRRFECIKDTAENALNII